MEEQIFKMNPKCDYKMHYENVFKDIEKEKEKENGTLKWIILNDLFFIVNFIMRIPNANHPFVVKACQEVEERKDTNWYIDLWSRWHWKSTILAKARTIQRVLKYPEKCTMFVSHTRPMAKKILRPIMYELENNSILKLCFSEALYDNPRTEAEKWSEDDGIIVKRSNKSRGESTIEAWGIMEGMPIGVHFDFIIADDFETRDNIGSPEMVFKGREAVDLCQFLVSDKDSNISIVGTPYSHEGIYIPFITDKKKADGTPRFNLIRKPATDNGLAIGEPILLSQQEFDDLQASMNPYDFACQILINPTPIDTRKLEFKFIQKIEPAKIPLDAYKFIVIDPAGDAKSRTAKSDAWAIMCFGVEPVIDQLGASNVYLLDAVISPLKETEAIEESVRMYIRNGIIQQVGVEKAATSTAEIHIANALRARGRYISVEGKSLVILKPSGRSDTTRIIEALEWPLFNSKLFISTDINPDYAERLKMEMDKFPFWHNDGINAWAYLYDMLKEYRFPSQKQDRWWERPARRRNLPYKPELAWMAD